jgi:hypothetical protein
VIHRSSRPVAAARRNSHSVTNEAEPMLHFAYVCNILILVPIALTALLSDRAATLIFENKFAAAPELTKLVGCLWTAILLGSIAGLVDPRGMRMLLMFQVVYKALFLATVLLPMAFRSGWGALPQGLTITFLLIVLLWPWLLWQDGR